MGLLSYVDDRLICLENEGFTEVQTMSDMSDFFRKTETELTTKTQQAETRIAKEKADALLLETLTATEWPLLIDELHSLTKDEGIGKMRFHWTDRTLSLGPALLTIWEADGMGLRPNAFRVNRSRVGEQNNTEDLTSSLKDGHLAWNCNGVRLGTDRTTAAVARSLVADLVSRYTEGT